MRELIKSEKFACYLDEEVPCIVVQYLKYQTNNEIFDYVNRASKEFVHLKQRFPNLSWLSNNLRQESISPEVIYWANTEWLPGMIKAGLKRVALCYQRETLTALSLEEFSNNARLDFPKLDIKIEYFSTVEEARNWLMQS